MATSRNDDAADAEYFVFCSDAEERDRLLYDSSSVLKRVSDAARLRLFAGGEPIAAPVPKFSFDARAAQGLLRSKRLGRVMIFSESLRSTQDVLLSQFRGIPAGAVAVASRQTGGRGRHGSVWESPEGALPFSMHVSVPIAEPQRLTYVQYVAALAAVECIAARPRWSHIPLRIKWPNDLYVDGKKVGGVLCEATTSGDVFDVIVGVGMNVTNDHPTVCLQNVMREKSGNPEAVLTRHEFLAAYVNCFERLFEEFSGPTGFASLTPRYVKAWLHSGQILTLGSERGITTRVTGLAPNGYVRTVREDNGDVVDLTPEDTSLDLFSGLVTPKARGERAPAEVK